MADALLRALIERSAATIDAHESELTALDQAIGDGDHGTNMKRGFRAIEAAADQIADLPFGAALHKAGMTLVMSVGGASGPLYGSLLMAMGKAGNTTPVDADAVAKRLAEGIEAVKKRGKSDVGAKTMLDVLVPVLEAIRGANGDAAAAARRAADAALEATRDMKATKGRASFLGDRSVGHLDPGARSSALLVNAVCDVVEGH
jgi:dihydroxyacetone kinase-like protein